MEDDTLERIATALECIAKHLVPEFNPGEVARQKAISDLKVVRSANVSDGPDDFEGWD